MNRQSLAWAVLAIGVISLSSCQRSAPANVRSIPHPDDSSKQVEFFLEAPVGKGPWPTVVLLHGHQEGARPGGRDFVDWGVLKQLAGRGYLAVAVSQPGYGNSSGPADYCGEFTQHAVLGVIAALRAEGLASPDRLLLQGVSRGAITAGLVAAQEPSVSGLVLISGVYDLPAYANDPNAGDIKQSIFTNLKSETGGSVEALEARSVIHRAGTIRAAVLVLHGAKDDRTDPQQAGRLVELISQSGGDARAIVYPEYGHRIPVEVRNSEIDPFIDRVLGEAVE